MSNNKKYSDCLYIDTVKDSETYHENFGTVLRKARKVNKMTQQQVADKAGIRIRHYQRFENGEREITNASFRIAMAVIMALEINAEVLLSYSKSLMTDQGE